MNQTPKRPWFRLQVLSWLVFSLLAGSLAVVNLGARVRQLDASNPSQPAVRWRHGWPVLAFERRTEIIGNSGSEMALAFAFGVGQPLLGVDLTSVAFDTAFAAIVITGSLVTVETWSRRTGFRIRFGLKAILATIGSFAVYFVILKEERMDKDIWLLVLNVIALSAIWLGIVLTWLAFFDLLGGVWPARKTAGKQVGPNS